MQIERMLIVQLLTSWELGNTLGILVIVELVTTHVLLYYISYFVPLLLSSMVILGVAFSRELQKIRQIFA